MNINEADIYALTDELRSRGCAVCVFQPVDAEGVIRDGADAAEFLARNRKYLEDHLSEAGNEALQTYAEMDGIAADDDNTEERPMTTFKLSETEMAELNAMGDAARPVDQDDWGSERQVAAQNAFFNRVEAILPADRFEELDAYCMKANTDEMVDEALRMVALL